MGIDISDVSKEDGKYLKTLESNTRPRESIRALRGNKPFFNFKYLMEFFSSYLIQKNHMDLYDCKIKD